MSNIYEYSVEINLARNIGRPCTICSVIPELEHDRVDAEGGHPEEEAGGQHRLLQPGLHQHPRQHAQQEHGRQARHLQTIRGY